MEVGEKHKSEITIKGVPISVVLEEEEENTIEEQELISNERIDIIERSLLRLCSSVQRLEEHYQRVEEMVKKNSINSQLKDLQRHMEVKKLECIQLESDITSLRREQHLYGTRPLSHRERGIQ